MKPLWSNESTCLQKNKVKYSQIFFVRHQEDVYATFVLLFSTACHARRAAAHGHDGDATRERNSGRARQRGPGPFPATKLAVRQAYITEICWLDQTSQRRHWSWLPAIRRGDGRF